MSCKHKRIADAASIYLPVRNDNECLQILNSQLQKEFAADNLTRNVDDILAPLDEQIAELKRLIAMFLL